MDALSAAGGAAADSTRSPQCRPAITPFLALQDGLAQSPISQVSRPAQTLYRLSSNMVLENLDGARTWVFEMGGQTGGRQEGNLVRTPFALSSHAHVLTLTPRTTRERPVVICANRLRMPPRESSIRPSLSRIPFGRQKNYPARITDTAAAYDGNIKYCNGIH